MKIELSQPQMEAITVASLKENRRWIQPYYREAPMFDVDPKVNKQMTKEMRDAFTKVLEWYGVYK